MSNNKQSSIEWYHYAVIILESESDHLSIEEYTEKRKQLLEQAKAMHRKEMIDFADNYVDNCVLPNENMAIPTIMDVPQYYNEKFGGNNGTD